MSVQVWTLAAALLAAPFWLEKPPAQWNTQQIAQFRAGSPWAQHLVSELELARLAPVTGYLASGRLARAVDRAAGKEAGVSTYEEYLAAKAGQVIVLAVRYPKTDALQDGGEIEILEKDSVLRADRKKISLLTYFPPTEGDPYLRLVFPRSVSGKEKRFTFEVYLPGIPGPYRTAEFDLKDIQFEGAPDF